jgi:hypothetical protein
LFVSSVQATARSHSPRRVRCRTPSFRELFPDQSLAPGKLLAVTQATLVVAQLDDAQRLFTELGDAKAFPVAARFFDIVGSLAKSTAARW